MEFVFGNGTEISSLDHSQITGVPEMRVNYALFSGLTRYDPRTSRPIPDIAESWTFNEDETVMTFKIRPGVVWSDGTPITAHTFVESWLYILAPSTAAPYAHGQGEAIRGAADYTAGRAGPENVAIRALDDYTFQVELMGSIASFLIESMSHSSYKPLPMHVVRQYGSSWTQPENIVVNGPFTLQEWIPNDRLIVVPNDKYWDKENVHLTKLTFLPIENTNTAYQAYRNGELDWSSNPPIELIDELMLRNDFQVTTQLGTYYYIINNQNPVLGDARVRKALSMSFDRNEIVSRITRGGEVPTFGMTPPMDGYNYPPLEGNGFNVPEAQRLLAEAGYPNGQGFPTFTVIYNNLDLHKLIAEYIQQSWRNNLGININLQNMEWGTFLAERRSSRLEIARAGTVFSSMNPATLILYFETPDPRNESRYSDPEVDRLIGQIRVMPNTQERNALIRRAEEIILVRDQSVIPIYHYVSQNLIDLDKWDGWYKNAMNIHPWVGIKRK